ncbi:MAG: Crp/Fnr family transcriptional regulator [Bacteroidales bacterium]
MDIKEKHCSNCGSKSECFKQLSVLELELADAHRVELKYKKNEHIAKQGSFVTHVLYLQKGLVKIYMETDQKNDIILNIFSGGELIGLPNLFTNAPLQYSVAAIEDSLICAIDKTVIENLILQNGKFAKAIIQTLNNCTLFHYKRLISASQKQLNGRMSDALLHLANNVYHSDTFVLSLTRKELAEFAGMSVMSAIRTLKDFAQNNIIAEEGNNVFKILDKAKLENYSKYG